MKSFIFFGANLKEFLQAVIFRERGSIVIDYPDGDNERYPAGGENYLAQGLRRTYYANDALPTPWLFDVNIGLIPYSSN